MFETKYINLLKQKISKNFMQKLFFNSFNSNKYKFNSSSNLYILGTFKRKRLFHINEVKKKPPPSLKIIYRNYIKASLKIYNQMDQNIAIYLFRLLEINKTLLKNQHQKLIQLTEMVQQFQQTYIKPQSQNKKQFLSDKKQKFNSNSNSDFINSNFIKLNLQKQRKQTHFKQKLLQKFQILHYFSILLNQCLDLNIPTDVRQKQQSKLIRICFNVSHFFTPLLTLRQSYNSLTLLDYLNQDMEYEILSQKDKKFVEQVIVKVCGSKARNHSKFKCAADYLKDQNAIVYEPQMERIIIQKQGSLKRRKEKKQSEQQKDEQTQNNQWKLMTQTQRNMIICSLFEQFLNKSSGKSNQSEIESKTKQKKRKGFIRRNQNIQFVKLLSNLADLNRQHNGLKSNEFNKRLRKQIIYICRRLFKMQVSNTQNIQGNQIDQTSGRPQSNQNQKLQLLQDIIFEYQYLDEIINKKKLILV